MPDQNSKNSTERNELLFPNAVYYQYCFNKPSIVFQTQILNIVKVPDWRVRLGVPKSQLANAERTCGITQLTSIMRPMCCLAKASASIHLQFSLTAWWKEQEYPGDAICTMVEWFGCFFLSITCSHYITSGERSDPEKSVCNLHHQSWYNTSKRRLTEGERRASVFLPYFLSTSFSNLLLPFCNLNENRSKYKSSKIKKKIKKKKEEIYGSKECNIDMSH